MNLKEFIQDEEKHKEIVLKAMELGAKDQSRQYIMDKIKEITTYHGNEGTSGYILSMEQYDAIDKVLRDMI